MSDIVKSNNIVKIGNYYVMVFLNSIHICNRKDCDGYGGTRTQSHNWYEFSGWLDTSPVTPKMIDKAYKKSLRLTVKERKITDSTNQSLQYLKDLKETYEV